MEELRIAVVGAGMMGADHVTRITERIVGARVSAIVEPDEARGKAAAEHAPGAQSWPITGASFILMYKNPENKANSAELSNS